METLIRRQGRIRELIEDFRDSDRRPFPIWEEQGRKIMMSEANRAAESYIM